MLKRIIQSLFCQLPPPPEPFHDAVLGDLKPGETGWTVLVSNGVSSFEFTIGGTNRPDGRLLAHAHEILKDYESFEKAARGCIEFESRDYPGEVQSELAELEIDNISLFWPERPDDGMIFFRGSDQDNRLWRCDYIARRPVGLGCDT